MFDRFKKFVESGSQKVNAISQENFQEARKSKARTIAYLLKDTTKLFDKFVKTERFNEAKKIRNWISKKHPNFSKPLLDEFELLMSLEENSPLDSLTLSDVLQIIDLRLSGIDNSASFPDSCGHWLQGDKLINSFMYMTSEDYEPPQGWQEFRELQAQTLVLYIYYSLSFDLSILPIDLEIDSLMTTLYSRIWYARGQLLNFENHFLRTQKSTKGHEVSKARRKEIALQYYDQIRRKDLTTWAKAGRIKKLWGVGSPSQRTIYHYLKAEGKQ